MKFPTLTKEQRLIDPERKQELLYCIKSGCPKCVHLLKVTHQRNSPLLKDNPWTCRAFPNGIPPEIVGNTPVRHDEPYPGDNGITYEPILVKLDIDKVGYYYNWDGDAFDAETLQHIKYESEVR
jgi:hypothetical protein